MLLPPGSIRPSQSLAGFRQGEQLRAQQRQYLTIQQPSPLTAQQQPPLGLMGMHNVVQPMKPANPYQSKFTKKVLHDYYDVQCKTDYSEQG